MAGEQQLKSREQDQQQSTPSSSSEIIPYVELDGEWTIPDTLLVAVWKTIEDQGLDQIVFWEGRITSMRDFYKFCKNPKNIIQFLFSDGKCIGLSWLTGVAGNYGFGHFCFFKHAWGKHTEDTGRRVLDYWTSMGDGFLDTIVGIVPAFNERAHDYVRRLGLKDVGEIPRFFRNQEGDRQGAKIFYYQV